MSEKGPHTSPAASYQAHGLAERTAAGYKTDSENALRDFTTASAALKHHKATAEQGSPQAEQETTRLEQELGKTSLEAASAYERADDVRADANFLVKHAAEVYSVDSVDRDAMQDEALELSQTPPNYVEGPDRRIRNMGGSPAPIVRPTGPEGPK